MKLEKVFSFIKYFDPFYYFLHFYFWFCGIKGESRKKFFLLIYGSFSEAELLETLSREEKWHFLLIGLGSLIFTILFFLVLFYLLLKFAGS